MRPLDLLISGNIPAFILVGLALIEAIALHEYAHAFAADAQGDRLPRAMGRLSLNPLRHLDPLGTLLIFIAGFGWGRPVEFRPQALASKRFGAALVALAGPGMNLLLAVSSAFLAKVVGAGVPRFVWLFLIVFAELNILLAAFNLIPIPPLDGSRLLTIFLPPHRQNIIFFLDRWGFFILIGLVLFGGFLLRPIFVVAQAVVLSIAGIPV